MIAVGIRLHWLRCPHFACTQMMIKFQQIMAALIMLLRCIPFNLFSYWRPSDPMNTHALSCDHIKISSLEYFLKIKLSVLSANMATPCKCLSKTSKMTVYHHMPPILTTRLNVLSTKYQRGGKCCALPNLWFVQFRRRICVSSLN